MKKYRTLVPIVMVLFMVMSWYTLGSDALKQQSEYNRYLTEARKYAEDGITKYAVENYNSALQMKEDADIYVEVADYYKAQKMMDEYRSWCEGFFAAMPKEPRAYDRLLEVYLTDKNYQSCFTIIETAEKRKISTDFIKKTSEQIKYAFKLDYNSYTDVGMYANDFCPVKVNESWGFADRAGKQRVSCKYTSVGAYMQSDLAPIATADGDTYYIDKTGSKAMVSKEKYSMLGSISDGKIVVQRTDGKYTYVDKEFKTLFGEYDYASTFSDGVAAVKNGDTWLLINSSGQPLTDTKYVDVKINENQIACHRERAFVATSAGEYIMINNSGKQVGTLKFTDARPFVGDEPTAVKINDRWCFVDKDGNRISDKTYENARAYSNGMAAVCVNGKWGFVDAKENIVIEPQFFDAKDFNGQGGCFIKTGSNWQLLKLYRLNKEG